MEISSVSNASSSRQVEKRESEKQENIKIEDKDLKAREEQNKLEGKGNNVNTVA